MVPLRPGPEPGVLTLSPGAFLGAHTYLLLPHGGQLIINGIVVKNQDDKKKERILPCVLADFQINHFTLLET